MAGRLDAFVGSMKDTLAGLGIETRPIPKNYRHERGGVSSSYFFAVKHTTSEFDDGFIISGDPEDKFSRIHEGQLDRHIRDVMNDAFRNDPDLGTLIKQIPVIIRTISAMCADQTGLETRHRRKVVPSVVHIKGNSPYEGKRVIDVTLNRDGNRVDIAISTPGVYARSVVFKHQYIR